MHVGVLDDVSVMHVGDVIVDVNADMDMPSGPAEKRVAKSMYSSLPLSVIVTVLPLFLPLAAVMGCFAAIFFDRTSVHGSSSVQGLDHPHRHRIPSETPSGR